MNKTARSVDRTGRGATTAPDPYPSRQFQGEDDLLAFLLVNTWRLITGRVLRSDVPASQLSAEELIDFWADDHTASGEGEAIRNADARRDGIRSAKDVRTCGLSVR